MQQLISGAACATKSKICRTHTGRDPCWGCWSCRDISGAAISTQGLDMDNSLQIVDSCAFDDKRGRTRCHLEIPGGLAFQARHKQFFRRYVQGIQHGLCQRPNRTWVLGLFTLESQQTPVMIESHRLTVVFFAVQVQGTNIRHYYNYILARAKAFKDTRVDWVRAGVGRLKKQSVDKGLLRETEAVQHQINSLLKCDVGTCAISPVLIVCGK